MNALEVIGLCIMVSGVLLIVTSFLFERVIKSEISSLREEMQFLAEREIDATTQQLRYEMQALRHSQAADASSVQIQLDLHAAWINAAEQRRQHRRKQDQPQ